LAVADRIVVMNEGRIEQVGTPMQVYRDPASPFVADFVGRINALPATLEAPGRVRIGARSFDCAHDGVSGNASKVYLRPEDVLARPIAHGDANVFEAEIDKIEFLGSYCLVRVKADDLGEHRLTVYLSLNFLAEQRLEVGGRLPLRLLPDRMRLF
ncbi:MAG TPA: TOBE domain-containing protein, partial [Burkholderiaceae bacterium]|nr:TOBE domain-containing protein [Burkholderiaceae bacterium]